MRTGAGKTVGQRYKHAPRRVYGPSNFRLAAWADITEHQRRMFLTLGWTAATWRTNDKPPSDRMSWTQVIAHDAFGPAVRALLYTQKTWESDDVAGQQARTVDAAIASAHSYNLIQMLRVFPPTVRTAARGLWKLRLAKDSPNRRSASTFKTQADALLAALQTVLATQPKFAGTYGEVRQKLERAHTILELDKDSIGLYGSPWSCVDTAVRTLTKLSGINARQFDHIKHAHTELDKLGATAKAKGETIRPLSVVLRPAVYAPPNGKPGKRPQAARQTVYARIDEHHITLYSTFPQFKSLAKVARTKCSPGGTDSELRTAFDAWLASKPDLPTGSLEVKAIGGTFAYTNVRFLRCLHEYFNDPKSAHATWKAISDWSLLGAGVLVVAGFVFALPAAFVTAGTLAGIAGVTIAIPQMIVNQAQTWDTYRNLTVADMLNMIGMVASTSGVVTAVRSFRPAARALTAAETVAAKALGVRALLVIEGVADIHGIVVNADTALTAMNELTSGNRKRPISELIWDIMNGTVAVMSSGLAGKAVDRFKTRSDAQRAADGMKARAATADPKRGGAPANQRSADQVAPNKPASNRPAADNAGPSKSTTNGGKVTGSTTHPFTSPKSPTSKTPQSAGTATRNVVAGRLLLPMTSVRTRVDGFHYYATKEYTQRSAWGKSTGPVDKASRWHRGTTSNAMIMFAARYNKEAARVHALAVAWLRSERRTESRGWTPIKVNHTGRNPAAIVDNMSAQVRTQLGRLQADVELPALQHATSFFRADAPIAVFNTHLGKHVDIFEMLFRLAHLTGHSRTEDSFIYGTKDRATWMAQFPRIKVGFSNRRGADSSGHLDISPDLIKWLRYK